MRLSSLSYVIVCINKRVTSITNEVLTSMNDRVYERYICYLEIPKKLARCTL